MAYIPSSFVECVSRTGLRSVMRCGGRAAVMIPMSMARARRRRFATATTMHKDGKDDRLPLAGLKVLDMTRVLAGVRIFPIHVG
jgi:hypothetical protein